MFLLRLSILVACLLTVGILGRAAGVNESLPTSRIIHGIVVPVPRDLGLTLSAGAHGLDAAARRMLAPIDSLYPADVPPQLATFSSTR